MTPLEALDKINTMFLAYVPREIREDKELNEDLFECIETAIKAKEQQDNIIKIIKEIIAFDKTLPDIKVDENNALSITSGLAMRFQREIENKERELFRDWILKECFPKEMKALDFIKEHLTLITIKNGKQLLDINYWDDEEGFDLVKEVLGNE